MKKKRPAIIVIALLLLITILNACTAGGGYQLKENAGLSENEIISGLKEALIVAIINAILDLSKVNGYLGNQNTSIPLPESIRQFEQPLRTAGLGSLVDQFKVTMNRAAERAVPVAKETFIDAAKNLTFTDARKILNGKSDEATVYFREKTEDRLAAQFRPIIHDAMSEVGVTSLYQGLHTQLSFLTGGQMQSFDLDNYVTSLAMDGLFFMVAKEEQKIRENPRARVTDILKKVFGSR